MSSILTVFVRKDLNMRKGKMAAQSAHAGGKLFLETLIRNENKLILSSAHEKDFLSFKDLTKKVEIKMVDSEEALNSSLDKNRPYAIIVDNGRTEFHGVLTTTCASQGLYTVAKTTLLDVPQTYGTEIVAKQMLIFSKENPLPKEIACELAVEASLTVLYKSMKKEVIDNEIVKVIDLSSKNALSAWVIGAFGKIAVATKTDLELDELLTKLEENGMIVSKITRNGNSCLAVAPQYPSDIDPFTKELSLI